MKVLHIYKDYYPVLGGIENHIRLLAEGQATRGLEVTVLVTNTAGRTVRELRNGVEVIKAARLANVASTPLSISLPRILHRLEPDIAHLQFPYPWGELAQLFLGRSRKTVITYQSDIVRQRGLLVLYRPLLRRVLAKADLIVATSQQYIESSPYLSRLADKCVVIPLGVEVEKLARPSDETKALQKRFGRPLLLFVGRLRYYKGLEYLFHALKEVEANLLVVGTGPMKREWHGLVQELGLGNRVHFLGDVPEDDLPAYYQSSDLFILPASHRSEAFGIVQVEAMAAGVPVISTELGTGTSFVNIHGETGFVVPPRNPRALAEAIGLLLSDPVLRKRMGERAQRRAFQEFSSQRMIDRVIAAYEGLLT